MPVLGSDLSSCVDLWAERPEPPAGAAQPDPSHMAGWVAIAFSLRGDGKASDLKVLDSEPKNEFVPGAVQGLSRWKFKPGAVRDHCVAIDAVFRR